MINANRISAIISSLVPPELQRISREKRARSGNVQKSHSVHPKASGHDPPRKIG